MAQPGNGTSGDPLLFRRARERTLEWLTAGCVAHGQFRFVQ